MLAIRNKYPAIARGEYTALDFGEKNLGGFLIRYEDEILVLVHNTSATETLTYDLSSCKALEGISLTKLCDSIGVGEVTMDGLVLTAGPQSSTLIK